MLYLKRLVGLLILLGSLPVSGQVITKGDLTIMANIFMNHHFPEGAREIRTVTSFHSDTLNTLNLFELVPEGWLLMAADKRVEPVIGFSFSGHFKWPDENENNSMLNWLNSYEQQIQQIVIDKSLKEQDEWAEIKESGYSKGSFAPAVVVNPLIAVNWDQGAYWNQFCPVDKKGPGGNVYVGCVAVSMAQAMSVFKSPGSGQGSNTYTDPTYGTQYANFANAFYKWSLMPATTPNMYNALVLYHCAISVNMSFGIDGSGALVSKAASALKNYFTYSKKIVYQKRTGTNQEWHETIIKQLNNGQPIVYSGEPGDGKSGHSFNIDGVRDNYFHINWGWSGFSNGYYTLDALNPATLRFNYGHAAILNIQPYYYPTDLKLSETLVRESLPAGSTIGKVSITDEAEDNIYSFHVSCDSSLSLTGWVKDFYMDGDVLKTGRIFHSADERAETIFITITDKKNNLLKKAVNLSLIPRNYIVPRPDQYDRNFFLFPNPVEDKLYIDSKFSNRISAINIYSVSGKKIRSLNISGYTEGISVTEMEKGFYIFELKLSNNTLLRQKFVKK